MKIEIDKGSGFCFGVVKAISKAEEALSRGPVFSLGDIVHNQIEVQRLEEQGLQVANVEQMAQLSGKTVLIRAHGEPPSTYKLAQEYGVEIIDATCPVVARLQQIIVEAFNKMDECGGQVVLLGKRGHAEVIGLIGQVDGRVIVIESMEELEMIDFSRPVYFLAQTTQSLQLFNQVSQEILSRAADPQQITINDTICRRVANRTPHLHKFASDYDCIIFVSGKKSSNGRVLFEACRQVNPHSYNIEDGNELQAQWFEGVSSVGICGATSTPTWLMERVAKQIEVLVQQ